MKGKGVTRRQFVARAAAIAAGSALLGAPRLSFAQAAASACPAETLKKIGEIASSNGKLKAVIKVKNAAKTLPGYAGSQKPMMRYFEGYDQQAAKPAVWPDDKTACLPGPTLRVGIGERVEITLLNQVDTSQFPAGTIDNAETGSTDGCDQTTNATVSPPVKKWYPNTRGDTFPNCLHASSTMNLHFHGTHVSPDGFADNVLVHVRPDPNITEEKVQKIFDEVFAECAKHEGATPQWQKVPESYRTWQAEAVRQDDLHALWKGKRGPVDGEPVLPLENQLAPKNAQDIEAGLWPQYFSGAYPNCFKVTESGGHSMGQAPGTYWYHAHKHGSTSINSLNGLAGALIIEGDYDRDLLKLYPNLKKTEKVLVVQTFEGITDLQLATPFPGGPKATTTNGSPVTLRSGTTPQSAPTIVMRPGEIQLWRIVNAQVQNNIGPNASFYPAGSVKWRQIAQDGVQFSNYNYIEQPITAPDDEGNGTQFTLVAGGRIDLLVQAPPDTTQTYELAGVVNLVVCGDPVEDQFPERSLTGNFPVFPPFLKDVPPCRIKRTLTFDWEQYRWKPGPADTTTHCSPKGDLQNPLDLPCTKSPVASDFPIEAKVGDGTIAVNLNRAPFFMIDGEQFTESKFYQTMVLGSEEEWTIYNNTNVPHPFHIHVNPFQVIEVHDPNDGGVKYTAETNGVWQDTVNVPSALKFATGTAQAGNVVLDPETGFAKEPGYVRIRSRFADFTGNFVLHCHILAHEDRGMMQLVRVIDRATPIKHH